MHDMSVVDPAEKICIEFSQGFGWKKAAVIIKIFLVRKIDGSGHMSGHGVDGFGFALEPFTGPGIDKDDETVCEFRLDFRRAVPQAVIGVVLEVFRFDDWLCIVYGIAPGVPFLPATIEYGHAMMTKPAHHPPESDGIGTTGGVIGNDLGFIADTPAFQGSGEGIRTWQGMAANRGYHGRGEILVQMDIA